MKAEELRPCDLCSHGLCANGGIAFYRVRIEQLVVDDRAVRRRLGLSMYLNSEVLAAALGPDEDIAKRVVEVELLICQDCAHLPAGALPVGALFERAGTREAAAES